ncbi:MAG: hypothetical protein QOC68_1071 [Solirubrobacteraceae bacterium]|nr:hypothetical protein [Solirubrobacteraceae bacterium]
MASVAGTLRSLPPESRMTGGAAAALALSLLLPWYQVSFFRGSAAVTDSRSALQVFTWVEAAILLVALAVLYLVWARAQRQAFHLPGGDGFIVSAAGAWALALIIWRLFDKPSVQERAATVGIQWGMFFSLLAAVALLAAGARVRAAGRPEPPNPTAEEPEWEVPQRARRQRAAERSGGEAAGRDRGRPREHTDVTQVLRERPPDWDGEPPEAPGRAQRPRGEREGDEPPPPPDRLF